MKVPSVRDVQVELKPPRARLSIDAAKASLQDVVAAIRAAGRPFDAKVLLWHEPGLSEPKLAELDKALDAVPGIKNTGAPDDKGFREITLDLKGKTALADILGAGKKAGVTLKTPRVKEG